MEIISRYPLLFIAIAWLGGLIIGEWLMQAWLIAVPAFIIGTLFIIASYRLFIARSRRWLLIFLCGFLLLGIARDQQHNLSHQSVLYEQAVASGVISAASGDSDGSLVGIEVELRGYIDTEPVLNGDLLKFMLRPVGANWAVGREQELATKERVLVHLYLQEKADLETVAQWERGMGIMLNGSFVEINLSSNPGQFDYQAYLAREHVYHKIVVIGIDEILLSASSAVDHRLNIARRTLNNTFAELFTQAEAGFLKSILLGESGDIPAELRESFAITGLSHILAISGLHLSIITFLLFGILLRLRMTRENAAATVMLVLIVYLILIGLRPSVVRATIMSLLMLYGIIYQNRIASLQAIGVALIVMTLYSPLWIYNVGFQLSFTITFSILFAYPELKQRLKELLGPDSIWQSKVLSALALVATTQLASFPIIFYNFHQYSLISWFANFLIVPLFSSLILPFALLILVLGTIKISLALLPAKIMSTLLQILFQFIEWCANLINLHIYGNIFSGYLVLFIYILIIWLIFRKQIKESFIAAARKRLIFIAEKITVLVLSTILIIIILIPNPISITFIDVGQGDSSFIKTTTNRTLLIDSGGTFDFPKESWQLRANPFEVGKNIVWPYLRYQGVKRLDYALLTHEDIDHMGGFFAVLERIEVGIFIVPSGFPRTDLGQQLAAIIKIKQIPVYHVEQAVSIEIDNSSTLLLLPAVIPYSTKSNDHSFAVIAEFNNKKIFFAADIEQAGEELLLDKYQLPVVDILKVGHHGSRTSTTERWLATLQPNNAIISVGLNNTYGHPAAEVLERLISKEVDLWRTDLQGAVLVEILKDKVQISQFGRRLAETF